MTLNYGILVGWMEGVNRSRVGSLLELIMCAISHRLKIFANPLDQIHDLKYSNDGHRFLVISGTSQAKLFSRDGEEEYVFSLIYAVLAGAHSPDWQGHIYQRRSIYSRYETHRVSRVVLLAVFRTNGVRRGHVGELSSCAWHPRNPQTFITGSADSTIR